MMPYRAIQETKPSLYSWHVELGFNNLEKANQALDDGKTLMELYNGDKVIQLSKAI